MPDQPTTATTATTAADRDRRSIDLTPFGVAEVWTEPEGTGAVVYHVTAPRITGAVSIRIAHARYGGSHSVSVGYGVDTYDSDHPAQWPERLDVNGIRLCGRSEISVENFASFGGPDDPHQTRRVLRTFGHYGGLAPAPPATVERACALIVALLLDFSSRPDLDELNRAAAANEARAALAQVQRKIAQLDTSIAEHQADRRRQRSRAESLSAVVESHPWTDQNKYRLPGLRNLRTR
ncbi:hypothetical protein [Nocardia noduli]|uniref:hypothetical protein n=1 Tax=Nocardia noduli TaxID=2815722 RepID=UPI001C23778C|nr:hypothetical protein [Nocardia noduli]